MKGYWSDKRPNGQPLEPGTVCWITDLEDGSHPVPTYGKDQEEVLQKLAAQNANAQLAIVRLKAPQSAPAPAPKVISPDQVMRATAELSDPAKSGQAVATLLQHATGIDPHRLILRNFQEIGETWEKANPEFYPHQGNRRLLTAEATQLAGGNLAAVTAAHLTTAFRNLQAGGYLLDDPESLLPTHTSQPNPSFPDESQVQRPGSAQPTRFTTGPRTTRFQRSVATPTRTLKYTEEQIRTMPLSKSRTLTETGDKDYAEACEFYFGGSQARA